MQECTLPYIPSRLHTKNNPIINTFDIGEFLYRRCRIDEIKNPFKSISITELSHNRGGLKSQTLCNPDDVLYSIREIEDFQRYSDKVVCTLVIKSLNVSKGYKKVYTQTKNDELYTCYLELLHEPVPCMYSHCVFRVTINGNIITYDNHQEILKKLSQIRNQLKEELASMVLQNQVSQDDNPTQ